MARRPKRKEVKAEDAPEDVQSDDRGLSGVHASRDSSTAAPAPNADFSSKRPRHDVAPPSHQGWNVPGTRKESMPPRLADAPSASSYRVPLPQTPSIKPLYLGKHVYSPIAKLELSKARISVVGIVMRDADFRTNRGNKSHISVILADASCIEGTGSAKNIVKVQTFILFHSNHEFLPNLKTGQILALREVETQIFNFDIQGVAKDYNNRWNWSFYDPSTDTVKHSPNVDVKIDPISQDEMQYYRTMAKDWVEIEAASTAASTAGSTAVAPTVVPKKRPVITLDQMQEKFFYDMVVEVVKSYQGVNPTLFVTDYSRNESFNRSNDSALGLGKLSYPKENNADGYVLQISLWDSAAELAQGVRPGEVIRLRNVRGKKNQYGMLEGALGSASDFGVKFQLLDKDDPARDALRERRTKLAGNVFDSSKTPAAELTGRQSDPGQQRNAESRSSEISPSLRPDQDRVESSPVPAADRVAVKSDVAVASSAGSPQAPSFPTPAQRALQAVQPTAASKDIAKAKTDVRALMEDKLWLPLPGEARTETPRPLICCNAPSAVPVTTLSDLQTTAKCPDAYKLCARIVSTEPVKVRDWARLECRFCNRLVPRHERFCTKCGDEDGKSLLYCLRFSIVVQETEQERHARIKSAEDSLTQHGLDDTLSVEILFHGKSSEKLLPFVDVKQLFIGQPIPIKQLKRFRDQLLFPGMYNRPGETTLSVHSFPVVKSGKIVREFAAFKQDHVLHESFDPDVI